MIFSKSFNIFINIINIILLTICLSQTQSKEQAKNAQLMPYPQQVVTYNSTLLINSTNFKFLTKTTNKCEILNEAIERYHKLSFISDCNNLNHKLTKELKVTEEQNSNPIETNDYLTNITIEVRGNCSDEEWPHLDMDEMYTLRIDTEDFPAQAFIFSNSIWGALRALETFSQLIQHKFDTIFTVNSTYILDYPRFSHRGLLVDTSRHFLPIHTLLKNLDAMSYHKMNVFHWHIVDDQSFPYVSETFPNLSSKGSYNSRTHVYNSGDIETVVQYARVRGIRVLVEFDTPGHTLSWGAGYPELLTQCYSEGKPNGKFGPLNPSRNSTFDFINSLFKEVIRKFPEQYFHLGGDEVNYLCWQSNPEIQLFMQKLRISGNYRKLEEYYFNHLLDNLKSLNKNWIVWQEVFDKLPELSNNIVVNVWKPDFQIEMYELTKLGFRVILSSNWYLNKISYGYDWFEYYNLEPFNFNGTKQQNELVIGGQASMWGEWVDANNFISRTWPRSMAVAERLWSSKNMNNQTEAQYRFVTHRCRMLERGLRFQPIVEPKEYEFGFCKCDYEV